MNIEPLESRIAPATLTGQVLTYTDIDGDKVAITISKGTLDGSMFTFDTGSVNGDNSVRQQLQLIDVNVAVGVDDANITMKVIKAGGGDGLAHVGRINSPFDLGSVTLKGDLGSIFCGDSDAATGAALKLLSVRSIGVFGTATQIAGGSLTSIIRGSLGALQVSGDIRDATINVRNVNDSADGTIGSVTIGGSLIGGAANSSGSISANGGIGSVKIGRDLIGGDGFSSGQILSDDGKIGDVTIGGSIIGGSGEVSGLLVGGELGAVKIGGNVKGGTESNTGTIRGDGKIGSVTIGGSLLGGAAGSSGSVLSDGDIGPVKIAHDVKGGAGDDSGKIDAGGKIASLTIGGSLLGGDGEYDSTTPIAQISAVVGIGAVRIGHDVQGGSGDSSGTIFTQGNLASITIGGSLLGGAGVFGGHIFARGGMGAVTIAHDVIGGVGGGSGAISTVGMLSSVMVGGSLVGGSGHSSGKITSFGDLGTVKIGHDVIGGSGSSSGFIESTNATGGGGTIAGVTIGGSLIGGSNVSTITTTGAISAAGTIAFVKIGHDLIGGSITGTTPGLLKSGIIESDRRIGSVFIGGSIIGGTDTSNSGGLDFNASIRAGDDIGSLTVRGGLIGNSTAGVIISARGQATPGATTDLAIGKITIGGRVELARIFAGYDKALVPRNADAQIGAVTVGGDWVASSIVAGAFNTGANNMPGDGDDNINFGNDRDTKINEAGEAAGIFSKIGSIAIAGQVFGTSAKSISGTDRFGFVAEQIGALKIGGGTFALDPLPNMDGRFLGRTGDMALHEIGAAFPVLPLPTASAKLINASTVTYDDADGDHVTVKFSKPLLTAGNVNVIFKFDTGMVDDGVNARQQLQFIDLRSLAAAGLGVTVTVVPGGGDRLANVGAILADDDLGTITLPGDLGRIGAGDGDAATRALDALNVRTFGRLGFDTQPPASATYTPFLGGEIEGGLGALTVKQDIAGARLGIGGALGSLTIGGSLMGGSATVSDTIITAQSIGAVKIGHHVQAGFGGSTFIASDSSIASVNVGGSVIGASINADGTTLGPVRIGHNFLGGAADFGGKLFAITGIGSVTIGGSLLGELGTASGRISSGGGIGAVKIGHNVVGGAGDESGKIDSAGKLASVTIGGSLLGGSGDQDTVARDGQIFAVGDIGPVNIGHNARGGAGEFSGTIGSNGKLAGATIGGSLVGGVGGTSGSIFIDGAIGAVKVGHDVLGGSGSTSGQIFSNDTLGAVTVGGSLVGGSASGTAAIGSNSTMGALKVGHDIIGGTGQASGFIQTGGKVAAVTIGGSLLGGSALFTGGILAGDLGPVKIGRDLIGGSIAGATGNLNATGYIESTHRIASVSIGGSIIAGIDDSTGGALTKNASIRAGDDLGAFSVKGSLIGNAGDGTAANLSKVIISARGQATLAPNATSDLAIKSLKVGGRVEFAQILAGYSTALSAANGNASIGPVSVGGDWIASNLAAGAQDDADAPLDDPFGDADDILIPVPPADALIARIASVKIKGIVIGTFGGSDHFGFVAQAIGSFKSLNFTAPLTSSATPDVIELSPITGDITIREV